MSESMQRARELMDQRWSLPPTAQEELARLATAFDDATAASIRERNAAREHAALMASDLGEALGTQGAEWDVMVRDVADLVTAADELDVVASALSDAECALEKAQDATAAVVREAEDLRLRARNAEECLRQALRENERLTSQRDRALEVVGAVQDFFLVYGDWWEVPDITPQVVSVVARLAEAVGIPCPEEEKETP